MYSGGQEQQAAQAAMDSPVPPGGVAVTQLSSRHSALCRKQGGIKCGKAG